MPRWSDILLGFLLALLGWLTPVSAISPAPSTEFIQTPEISKSQTQASLANLEAYRPNGPPTLVKQTSSSPGVHRGSWVVVLVVFWNGDPIVAGSNYYAYAGGDPINRSDPSGLDWRWNDAPVPYAAGEGSWEWDNTWNGRSGVTLDQMPDWIQKPPLYKGQSGDRLGVDFYRKVFNETIVPLMRFKANDDIRRQNTLAAIAAAEAAGGLFGPAILPAHHGYTDPASKWERFHSKAQLGFAGVGVAASTGGLGAMAYPAAAAATIDAYASGKIIALATLSSGGIGFTAKVAMSTPAGQAVLNGGITVAEMAIADATGAITIGPPTSLSLELGEHVLAGKTTQEVIEMAAQRGLQTPRDGLILWSGLGRGDLGIIRSQAFARQNGGMTLEMTPGGEWLHNLNLFGKGSPFSETEAMTIWEGVSQHAVSQATGQVRAVLGQVSPKSVFRRIEIPEISVTPGITGIDELYLIPRIVKQ